MCTDDEKRPLAVRLGHLGDVVLTTGVLDWWGKTNNVLFDVLTRPQWVEVYENHPQVRSIVTMPNGLDTSAEFIFLRKLAQQYAGQPLYDLHGNLRTRVLRLLWSGKVHTYAKMSLERRLFASSCGRLCGESLRKYPVLQRYALAFTNTALLPPAEDLLPVLYLSDAEKKWADEILGNVRPVALHPFATHAPKTWSLSVWQEFVSLLDSKAIPWIVLGKGESGGWGCSANNFINKTSLRQSAALISHCCAMVSGDSGPMHLAGAVKTPVIGLFGATIKEWGFYPQGKRDVVLEAKDAAKMYSLHGKSSIKENVYPLDALAPSRVYNALKTFVQ